VKFVSNEIISILVLAAVFAIAIGVSVNMGLLAFPFASRFRRYRRAAASGAGR
jgi:Dicarboxylate carrier protein MatC N-terminus